VNANVHNTNANMGNLNAANSAASGSVVETHEPDQYQATVKLTFQAIGDTQNATLPPLSAKVARNGADRMMEFLLPTGEKVIYLDKGTNHFLILPNRKQYAEINQETVGFDVRRMMMPAQIVDQLKGMQGVQQAGEDVFNGRPAVKYTYNATANTQTQAGNVETQSYFLVDKETGLPLRSETVSASQNGQNVQGYKGLRLVTEMSDIQMSPAEAMFEVPAGFSKIDPEQVRAQANAIFSAASAIIGQMINQAKPAASPSVTQTPTP
jgi:hypothetical protein